MEITEKSEVYARNRRLRLLDAMRQTAVDGMRAAATRTEHMRWTSVIEMSKELEEELR